VQPPPQQRDAPAQAAPVPPVPTPTPTAAPAPSSSTSLEELVRMMTLQNMQFQQEELVWMMTVILISMLIMTHWCCTI